jgi:hypothetical protein
VAAVIIASVLLSLRQAPRKPVRTAS